MENTDLAQALAEMADLLELSGGNAFKVRAYRQAAELIDTHPVPVAQLLAAGTLEDLPGIGAHIRQHLADLLAHGSFPELDAVRGQVPEGLLEVLRVEGVGPKTALAAWKGLGITTVDGLEAACRDGALAGLPRMGAAKARNIQKAIERYRGRRGRVLLHRALPVAEALVRHLAKVKGVEQAEAAGSLRRRKETVGDLDLVVAAKDAAPVMAAFRTAPDLVSVEASGPTRATGRLRSGLQVDVRVVEPDVFGAALHYFTGSKAHNIAVRTRAMKAGLKLSEYGLFDARGKRLAGRTEEDVYRAVGLPWIPPELREAQGELEAAERGRLPDLVELDDLRGDLHVHTRASSDAKSTLDEVAGEARALGLAYVAITDHTRSRPLGLDDAALAAHAKAIRAADAKRHGGPRLLAGAEVDILGDGSLDIADEVLDGLDLVVASVHQRLNDAREVMTARMVKAARSGHVHVLGHPSNRQLGTRDASDFDLEQVIAAAKPKHVALEVNAQPDRLDLTDQACRLAKAGGVPVVISSDAHHAGQLENLRYGVWVARRGWLEKKDVLNTLPLEKLRARLAH